MAVTLTAMIVLITPTRAEAAFIDANSLAFESWNAGAYTGVAVLREDTPIAVDYDGCAPTYGGNLVRQRQVVRVSGTSNWMELGTAHKCNYVTFWYAGYGVNGTWHPLTQMNGVVVNPPQTHAFYIYRTGPLSTSPYRFQIDSTPVADLTWWTAGQSVSTGLHSFDSLAWSGSHTYRDLRRQLNGGSWTSWSGAHSQLVQSPPMCGAWSSATVWRASENAPC